MAADIYLPEKANLLDEIISNVTELPLESQHQVLMMAKAMQNTRICIKEEKILCEKE